jgi:ribonuclease HII
MLEQYLEKGRLEAGCDEAGRGCLAGPVVAAAVILPENFTNELLTDSKLLTDRKRYELRPIIEQEALAWAVAFVDNKEIEELNILNASFEAMHRAVNALSITPEHLLIDGNRFNPHASIEHSCIIKGDGKYLSIAAASILAKTYRDDYMNKLHEEYSMYGWDSNKGYPTKIHRKAIKQYGVTRYHRTTFNLLGNDQLSLEL